MIHCTAPPEVQWIIYGVGIILIVFFLPRGIVPAFAALTRLRLRQALRRPAGLAPVSAPDNRGADLALEVRDLAVHIGGLVALGGVSFQVPFGAIVSLIGPNGAGNTTAFNVITGFMRPTDGQVF